MAAFTKDPTLAPEASFTTTDGDVLNFEGGNAKALDTKSELYTLALTHRFTDTYYESADTRTTRMITLFKKMCATDSQWLAGFLVWLRNEANIRSAAVLGAVIYANEMSGKVSGSDVTPRQILGACLTRADEPMEALAVQYALYGKSLKHGFRQGIGDACRSRWNEYTVLKWNNTRGHVTMRDVLNVCHVSADPNKPYQNGLFKYIVDKAYGNDLNLEGLNTLALRARLQAMTPEERRALLISDDEGLLKGMTWEFISSWSPDGLNATAWEAIIPEMQYMATLRNLRNFDQAKISKKAVKTTRDKLADPEEVRNSKQLPHRFFSAYKNSSDTWVSSLSDAMDTSVENVPELSGKTLVMVDSSGSMMGSRWDTTASKIDAATYAGFFASVANSAWDTDTFLFDTNVQGYSFKDKSILRGTEAIRSQMHGGGTMTHAAVEHCLGLKPQGYYSRILILSDAQSQSDYPGFSGTGRRYSYSQTSSVDNISKFKGNIFLWDLAGYGSTNFELKKRTFLFSGFDGSAFDSIGRIENGLRAEWPWLTK